MNFSDLIGGTCAICVCYTRAGVVHACIVVRVLHSNAFIVKLQAVPLISSPDHNFIVLLQETLARVQSLNVM